MRKKEETFPALINLLAPDGNQLCVSMLSSRLYCLKLISIYAYLTSILPNWKSPFAIQ